MDAIFNAQERERVPAGFLDLATRQVSSMYLAASCEAEKPGATIAQVMAALKAQAEHSRKDLRTQGRAMFGLTLETPDEWTERVTTDPVARAEYEAMCEQEWARGGERT